MTPYDTVPYPGLAFPNTHPDHLAAIASYRGLTPASPVRCRVLEVGCGDGGNLVPMAYGLPGSEFIGIDLAGDAIESARAFAARAGVGNAVFEQCDLARYPETGGTFDYVVAHGVYSWIPGEVRDALMALIGRHLAPAGIAFVSYNTYPGCHLRRMVWEMLAFHTAEIADPQSRIVEAQALIRLLAHGNTMPDEYTHPLAMEAQRMEARLPALLFHDDLAPVNEPVYFHEFADHAAAHGLQYLAEASFGASSYAGIAPEARGVLATLDPMTREQYLDFIRCRRFRESLLCRETVAIDREARGNLDMLTYTAARRVRTMPRDPAVPESESAHTADVAAPGTDAALMRAILDTLHAAAPLALSQHGLLAALRERDVAAAADGEEVVRACVEAGVIEPHVVTPRVAHPPPQRPTASDVVRCQLARGDIVTSLWHCPVKVDDEVTRRLLPLLDGTRDRETLVTLLGDLVGSGDAGTAALDRHLRRLAELGLLVA